MKNMNAQIEKPTKAGVKAALILMGYSEMPNALKRVGIKTGEVTNEEMAFAKYLVYDTDFGGAWNDEAQINMHCVSPDR